MKPCNLLKVAVAGTCGCITLALLVVAAIFGHKLRTPVFSGFSPISIEIGAEQDNGRSFYEATCTDREACSNLVRVLAQAARADFHACPERGWLKLNYENGLHEMVLLKPGHDRVRFDIRFKGDHFTLSREQLVKVLTRAGFDASRLPQNVE